MCFGNNSKLVTCVHHKKKNYKVKIKAKKSEAHQINCSLSTPWKAQALSLLQDPKKRTAAEEAKAEASLESEG